MTDNDLSLSKQPFSVSSVNGLIDDYGITASTVQLPFLAAGLLNSAVAALLTELSSKFFEMAISISRQEKLIKMTENEENLVAEGKELGEDDCIGADKPNDQIIVDTIMKTATTTAEPSAFLATIPCNSEPETSEPSTDSILEPSSKNVLTSNNPTSHLATGLQPIDTESFGDTPIFPSSTMRNTNEPKDMTIEIKQESNDECLQPIVSHYSTMYPNFTSFTTQQMTELPIQSAYPIHSSGDMSMSTTHQPVARITTVDYLKRHVCNFRGCNKIFFSRSSLSCHRQIHALNKPHMCMYPGCGSTFASESLLISHSQLHESKQVRDRHACSFPGCSKVFVSRDCLIEHTRVHTGERPFACDYPGCSHRFARRCNLFAHKRVHLDKNQRRQYHCIHPGCDKTFLYARSLSEHMNVHLGERPYVCDFPGCFKSFTSKSYLYAHRRIHLGSDKAFNNLTSQDESSSIAPIPVTVTIPINPTVNQTQFQGFIPNTSAITDPSMLLGHPFYPSQPG